MGTLIAPEADPLAFMGYLIDWHKVDVTRNPGGNWHEAKSKLTAAVSSLVQGRFMISLDREDEMTDTVAHFAVRCEDRSDAEIVAEHFPFTLLYPPPKPRQDPGPAPDWLYKFAAEKS